MKRKNFIQSVLGASAFAGLSLAACNDKASIQDLIDNTSRKVTGNMFGFLTKKTEINSPLPKWDNTKEILNWSNIIEILKKVVAGMYKLYYFVLYYM